MNDFHQTPGDPATPFPLDEFATYTPRKQESLWKRIGGGSLGMSLLVHALFVLIAVFLIKFVAQRPVEEPVMVIPGGGHQGNNATKAALSSKQKAARQSQSRNKKIVVVGGLSPIKLQEVPSPVINLLNKLQNENFGTTATGRPRLAAPRRGERKGPGFGPGSTAGFTSLPPSIRSRCSPQERAAKMKENGGSEECERAVIKALDWLKTQQGSNGAWGSAHRTAMTGLALLCYYGHCETMDSPCYGPQVMNGVTYLLDTAGKNQGFFTDNLGRHFCTYEHGIATYAMGETYSFAKFGSKALPGLREGFERGVQIILDHQTPNGGWSYGGNSPHYNREGDGDISVTGWQFQALKAAQHTKLRIPGLEKATKRVTDFLESRITADGGVGNNTQRGAAYGQYTMTGVGVLGLQTLAGGSAGGASKGLRFLSDELARDPCDWTKNANLYCWYYNTQAFFQKGGKDWETWNQQCRDQLLANQNPDGSYAQESGDFSAATSAAAGPDAAIYRTCLCTLMLEVYYRYLKVGSGDAPP